MITPVILAGGSGTRLWPLSRSLHPKQLIRLSGEHTMLQQTSMRLDGFESAGNPIVICSEAYRFMAAEQMRQIDAAPNSIILEPAGRNTAPALAVAALKVLKDDKDPLLLVLPADHYISRTPKFQKAVQTGAKLAEKGHLITFGISPHAPETGYGYIKKGKRLGSNENVASTIERFVEKPDYETAVKYVESGNYFWNSGMFMFKASCVLKELETFVPDIVKACKLAVSKGTKDLDFFRLDPKAFTSCPADSIDYAVMEKTTKGAMVPMDAGWNDLGSWEALWRVGEKDVKNNVVKGDVLIEDVNNSYLHATSRLLTAVGLSDHIVIETSDAVMISPRNRVQDVKRLVDKLKSENRNETAFHKKVYRPWGTSENVVVSNRFKVNRIKVKPGAALSLQKHFNRAEHWIVVRGTALVKKGDEKFVLTEDSSTYIPAGIDHRLENPGKIPLDLIEVQTGSYLDEDDIVRLEDLYGRTNQNPSQE